MNDCIRLTSKEKLMIAIKIIDVYLAKIQRGDFTTEILESLAVWNYNPSNISLCKVRINKKF